MSNSQVCIDSLNLSSFAFGDAVFIESRLFDDHDLLDYSSCIVYDNHRLNLRQYYEMQIIELGLRAPTQ